MVIQKANFGGQVHVCFDDAFICCQVCYKVVEGAMQVSIVDLAKKGCNKQKNPIFGW